MFELELWGTGGDHAARWNPGPCPKCDGRGLVGPATFPCTCPLCGGTGSTEQEVTHG